MARVTISLPENLAAAAERQAQAERRSTSAYVALLIEADVTKNKPVSAWAEKSGMMTSLTAWAMYEDNT